MKKKIQNFKIQANYNKQNILIKVIINIRKNFEFEKLYQRKL